MSHKKINFTLRKNIRKKDVQIAIREDHATNNAWFDANLTLSNYAFPAEALIFIEAYRRTQRNRFYYGTVCNIVQPSSEERTLIGYNQSGMLLFRVKVVNAQTGLIIGEVDRINPSGNKSAQQSLLPVEPEDLGESCWKIDFDIDNIPVLLVNKKLKPTWRDACNSPYFKSLVYPAVLKEIMHRILYVEKNFQVDGEHWTSIWLKFAVQNLKMNPPPRTSAQDTILDNELDAWINDVVERFCGKLKSLAEFNKEYSND